MLWLLISLEADHKVQAWDSLVPNCASIVNFLTAWRHTAHISYFWTARLFEYVCGWTIVNLSVSDHPLVAGPLTAHSAPQWHPQPRWIWCRAAAQTNCTIYFSHNPNIFRRCVVLCFTKAPWATMPRLQYKLTKVWGGGFYVENVHTLLFPWWDSNFSQVISHTGGCMW